MKQESEPVCEHFLRDGLSSEGKTGEIKQNTVSSVLSFDSLFIIKPSDNSCLIINKGMCRTRAPSKGSSHPQSLSFLSFSRKTKRH